MPDVHRFIAERSRHGLAFGSIYRADGYVFANAKDPAGNFISISDRVYRLAPTP